jgi:putative ABC transport system permease protein
MHHLVARLQSLWRSLRRRDAIEADMTEEFRHHLELRAADLVRSGLSPAEALRRARAEFGSGERYKEEGRAARGLRRIDELRFSWLDFKLGLRMLVKYPGLTLVGGLAMAFAIAVGAAAFEAIRQVARPVLPFAESDRIVAIRIWDATRNRVISSVAYDFLAWREQLRSVRDLGAFRTVQHNLITEHGESGAVRAAEISASAFRITGVAPLHGRFLVDGDERVGAPLVVVLGHDIWQARFAGDPAVIGRTVQLGRRPATIVGVMPKSFAFPMGEEVWAPLRLSADISAREGPELGVFGRLAAGSDVEQAQAELTAVGQRASAAFPETHLHLRPQVGSYAFFNSPVTCTASWKTCTSLLRATMYSTNLFFVFFLVLMCANVALLMFARAAAREAEIVVRNALGASRGRIITQLVAEALVLAAAAAAIGLPAAHFILRLTLYIMDYYVGNYPFWWEATLSLPSIAYAILLTALGAVVAGALPALRITRGLVDRLRQVSAGGGGLKFSGVWSVVIVVQITLTVVFMATAAFMTQQITMLRASTVGFRAHEYLAVQLAMNGEIPASVYSELERRLLAEAGVNGVTFASQLPGHDHGGRAIEVEGSAHPVWVQTAAVSEDYFSTLGLPISAGHAFHPADMASDQAGVIVNPPFVTHLLGGRSAIGQRVRFRVAGAEETWGPWQEIVGVAQQSVMSLDPELKQAGVYVPLKAERSMVHMAVHFRGDPLAIAARVRAVATAVEPELRLSQMQPLHKIRDVFLGFLEIWLWLVIVSSALVLALSLAGIYAIMSFTVSRRTREIGIRVALGADRRRLLLSIFARPLARFASGVLVGVTFLVILLDRIPSVRTAAIALAFAVFMMGVCLLACIVPTRRALRIQPIEALAQD